MKRFFTVLTLLSVFILNTRYFIKANAEANTYVDIKINEQYIHFSAAPFISNGVTYVPLRFFAEALGAEVNWNVSDHSASVSKNTSEITVYPYENKAYINGVKADTGGKTSLIEGRIFVPVRFIAGALKADVSWDGYYRNVCVFADTSAPSYMVNYSLTDDDIFWLGRIIEAESAGEPYIGKVAVGNVILNRVKSKEFPNTIYGVIFDKKYGVQFQPVMNGMIYNNPSHESIAAAKAALKGEKPVGECLYFLNPKTAENFWIVNNRVYHSTIKNHDFYV